MGTLGVHPLPISLLFEGLRLSGRLGVLYLDAERGESSLLQPRLPLRSNLGSPGAVRCCRSDLSGGDSGHSSQETSRAFV